MAGSPLNVQPRGLLDFLGIKNGEWGPRELNTLLQGTTDLWRHYVAANSIDIMGTTAPPGAPLSLSGSELPITWTLPAAGITPNPVPNGELWYIDSMSVHGVLSDGAGSQLMTLGISGGYGGGFFHLFPFTPVVPTASSANSFGMVSSLLYPYWAKSGQTLSVFFAGTIATGEVFQSNVTARLVRMRV